MSGSAPAKFAGSGGGFDAGHSEQRHLAEQLPQSHSVEVVGGLCADPNAGVVFAAVSQGLLDDRLCAGVFEQRPRLVQEQPTEAGG